MTTLLKLKSILKLIFDLPLTELERYYVEYGCKTTEDVQIIKGLPIELLTECYMQSVPKRKLLETVKEVRQCQHQNTSH